MGGVYEYVDAAVTPGTTCCYKLGELEVDGARNWYGPASTSGGTTTVVALVSFAAENRSSLAFIWWLAVAATLVGASGLIVSRLRKSR